MPGTPDMPDMPIWTVLAVQNCSVCSELFGVVWCYFIESRDPKALQRRTSAYGALETLSVRVPRVTTGTPLARASTSEGGGCTETYPGWARRPVTARAQPEPKPGPRARCPRAPARSGRAKKCSELFRTVLPVLPVRPVMPVLDVMRAVGAVPSMPGTSRMHAAHATHAVRSTCAIFVSSLKHVH